MLSLCQRQIGTDWQVHFGKRLLLLETFVDPTRFQGTVYRAANWKCVGQTQGYRRTREGYSANHQRPKLVFVRRPLQQDAQAQLARPILAPQYQSQGSKMMMKAEHMKSLPNFLKTFLICAVHKVGSIRFLWFLLSLRLPYYAV